MLLYPTTFTAKDIETLANMASLATEVQLRISELDNAQSVIEMEPGCRAFMESMRQAATCLGARAAGFLEDALKRKAA